MRLVLYILCVLIILLASFLFVLGYDGTQIREYLLGVAAIVVVATRIIRPRQSNDAEKENIEKDVEQRGKRLSVSDGDSERGLEYQDPPGRKQRR